VSADLFAMVLDEAKGGPPGWWWLSFADGRRPAGQQFLGVAVVRAAGFGLAVMRAHALGINPGGEVSGQQIPASVAPPDEMLDKLVTDKDRVLELEEGWCAASRAASGKERLAP